MTKPATHEELGPLGWSGWSANVWVAPTDVLPPVRLSIHAKAFGYQDYYSPDEARRLAEALLRAADVAEVLEIQTELDAQRSEVWCPSCEAWLEPEAAAACVHDVITTTLIEQTDVVWPDGPGRAAIVRRRPPCDHRAGPVQSLENGAYAAECENCGAPMVESGGGWFVGQL